MGIFKNFVEEGWWDPPEKLVIDFGFRNRFSKQDLEKLLRARCITFQHEGKGYILRLPPRKSIDKITVDDIKVELWM